MTPRPPPRRLTPQHREPLHSAAATRQLEALVQEALPAHELMKRAGEAVARLARARVPHAQRIWVATGPGNNGGDGWIAALHLHNAGVPEVWVTQTAEPARLPADAAWARQTALEAGVTVMPHAPASADLIIDALLGLGASREPEGLLGEQIDAIRNSPNPVLCVDLPSALDADTGACLGLLPRTAGPRLTLSLLTLKPGLFTAHGRDLAGEIWFDDLGAAQAEAPAACAHWGGAQQQPANRANHAHASHKGSFGDVAVIGGQGPQTDGSGMVGAALLAARAALHGGAGRVFVGLLDGGTSQWDPQAPELMVRRPDRLTDPAFLAQATVVAGCGGGKAIGGHLEPLLQIAKRLVLDADALNLLAAAPSMCQMVKHRRDRGLETVITPHPLEAARLLGVTTAQVMTDRLRSATALAHELGVVCVLKGAGTVVASTDAPPWINATGNARLATAGTGDVLAGMLGASLSCSPALPLRERVERAVAQHGALADAWPESVALSASRLADAVLPW